MLPVNPTAALAVLHQQELRATADQHRLVADVRRARAVRRDGTRVTHARRWRLVPRLG